MMISFTLLDEYEDDGAPTMEMAIHTGVRPEFHGYISSERGIIYVSGFSTVIQVLRDHFIQKISLSFYITLYLGKWIN